MYIVYDPTKPHTSRNRIYANTSQEANLLASLSPTRRYCHEADYETVVTATLEGMVK